MGPCHILSFAGIELDCLAFEARLPQSRKNPDVFVGNRAHFLT